MHEDQGAGLFGEIHASLGSLVKHARRVEARWIQRASDAPKDQLFRFQATIGTPTAATTLQSMETGGLGPQPGQIWIVRAIRVGGITPTTTAAGRADIYQSPVDPTYGGAAGNTANWIDQAVSLPLVAMYSSRQIVLRAPDNLYVVVTNGTAAQQYVPNVQVEVYNDGSAPVRVEL